MASDRDLTLVRAALEAAAATCVQLGCEGIGKAKRAGTIMRQDALSVARIEDAAFMCAADIIRTLDPAAIAATVEESDEDLVELLETTANFLRGMSLDRRIPQDTRESILHRIADIDSVTDLWESHS